MIRGTTFDAVSSLCGGPISSRNFSQVTELTGAGSRRAYPIYSKWAAMYAAKTGVKIDYHSIGSSGSIRQLSEEIVHSARPMDLRPTSNSPRRRRNRPDQAAAKRHWLRGSVIRLNSLTAKP